MINIPKVFIGYDKDESVAAYTLAHSIKDKANGLVDIVLLDASKVKEYTRPRGIYDSTSFTNIRFLVPYFCNYEGFAIFMDCDMLCLGDIYDLWDYSARFTDISPLACVKHSNYALSDKPKFLNQVQTINEKKNWSSVMLFNNPLCHKLSLDYVNTAGGLDLHQFKWINDNQEIISISKEWNCLVGTHTIDADTKLLHYTEGGPYFKAYSNVPYKNEWFECFKDMCYCKDSSI